ncbi:MAG: hypothetical protein IKA76_09435 [Clostridia bacterium]|nr:hypothetical protein [Clostridia bacterium]
MFPNIPKKTTATVQVWVSVALVILALILSFMPIIKLNTEKVADTVNELFDEVEGLDLEELPDSVEVSAPTLISGISFFIDIGSELLSGDPDEDKLEDAMETEDAKEAFALVAGLMTPFADVISGDADFESITAILGILVSSIALLYVVFMTLLFPIFLIVKALIALISALKHLKEPELATARTGAQLPGLLELCFTLLLFQCVLPGMEYGAGALGILIVSIISIVLNTVAVRLRAYRQQDMIYANIAQGVSLVGVIGFMVFFFNLIETGVLNSFLNGGFANFLVAIESSTKLASQSGSGYIVDGIMMVLYIVLAFSALSYITVCTKRLSLSTKKGEHHLARAIFMLPVFIIPTVIAGAENIRVQNKYTGKWTEASSLMLDSDQEAALTGVLVGLIIILLAEIALIVLRLVFCKNMTKDDRQLVLAGNAPDPNVQQAYYDPNAQGYYDPNAQGYYDPNAQQGYYDPNAQQGYAPAAEAAPVEEAPVDAAPAEEAPAEEALAEDAPAEEAPAEEAPAEEAPVEEAAPNNEEA